MKFYRVKFYRVKEPKFFDKRFVRFFKNLYWNLFGPTFIEVKELYSGVFFEESHGGLGNLKLKFVRGSCTLGEPMISLKLTPGRCYDIKFGDPVIVKGMRYVGRKLLPEEKKEIERHYLDGMWYERHGKIKISRVFHIFAGSGPTMYINENANCEISENANCKMSFM